MVASANDPVMMDKTKPDDDRVSERKPSTKEGSVKHVVRTGLPPGVNVDDWKDPGKNSPKGPTDNRS